jgi:hypothetical protein
MNKLYDIHNHISLQTTVIVSAPERHSPSLGMVAQALMPATQKVEAGGS